MPDSLAHTPVPMLDFSRQFAALRDELMQAIEEVCASQRFILGPQVESFERAAALACDVPHAVGCASGTDALWLALAAADIGEPDGRLAPSSRMEAVITTPFSFFATASSILRVRALPVFADIDPFTFNLSPERAREALERFPRGNDVASVRAIMPVHLYGQCADMDALKAIPAPEGGELLLIEDAAQAFGATWNGVAAGALGTAAAFSFYPTKNLSAMGDAGLMTTTSLQVADGARSLRAHGMQRRYFHDEVGWNSRLDSLQAAVLEVKLKYIAGWNQRRRDLAANYNQLFLAAGIGVHTSPENPATTADGVVLPYVHPRAQHVFHQYVVRVQRRHELREHLAALGIGSEIYYPLPLHMQTALHHLGYKDEDFPEARRASSEVLALPIYPELREDEQEIVVEAIRGFYD